MRTRAWIGGFGLAAVCGSVLALAACSSNDSNGGGSGGANNAKGGGTSSSGGSTSTSGGTTSSSGGTSSSSGGSSSSSGGSSSSSGGSNGGGSAGMSGFACAGKVADCAVISDFPTTANMAVWGGTDFGGGITTFNGVTRDNTKADALHMTGVGNKYGGFGIWFNSCSDLSQYTGVSFKISGSAGTVNTIDFQAQTNSDYPWQPDAGASKKGACTGTDPDPMKAWNDCNAPGKTGIALTSTPTTVTINWSDITGGKPKAWDTNASPKELVGIQWQFPAATDEYMVDVTVDDVTFIGGTKTCATASGSGGAGGAGGASNGGSSNAGAGGASGGASSGGAGGASGGASSGGAGGASGGAASGGAGGARGGAGGASGGGAGGNAGNAGHGGN